VPPSFLYLRLALVEVKFHESDLRHLPSIMTKAADVVPVKKGYHKKRIETLRAGFMAEKP
jgi:hypothetical protein